jgi:hypothetical protein
MAPDPAATRSKDEGDLNLLSILHYVWTGLFGCSTLGLVAYFIAIAGFVANAPSGPHGNPHDQEVAAGVVGVIGVVMFVIMVPLSVLHLLAAAGLKKRARYTLILVVSGLACLSFPLGTALGVFTIVVLMRPSVKALFAQA